MRLFSCGSPVQGRLWHRHRLVASTAISPLTSPRKVWANYTACCVPFFSGKNLTKTGKKQYGYPLLCRREKCFQNIMLFLNVFLLSKDSKNGIFISRTLHVFILWKIVMLFHPLSLGEITSKHALLLSYKCGKNVPNELERPLGCFSCFFT